MVAPVGSLLSALDSGADNNYLLHKKFKYLSKGTSQVSREGEEKEEMSTTSDPSQPAPLESDKEATGGSNSSVAGDVAASTGTSLPPLGKDKPAYLIRWNRFEDQVCNAFAELFCSDQFVDVTLACDGELIRAHKIVLAMSSPFFRRIFQETPCKHPVVIIKGMGSKTLKNILQYLYLGEVVLQKEEINNFMDAADYLSICGVLANLYSCDISTTTVDDSGRERDERDDSETESSSTKFPDDAARVSEPEESRLHTDVPPGGPEEDKDDSLCVSQSPVIKYHGVKSRWNRRYSNTSYHGTPTTSSPVDVEHKRSASAGEVESTPQSREAPSSQAVRSKVMPSETLAETPSDVEMGSGGDEERYEVSPTIREREDSPEIRPRKIIQRAYPKDYSASYEDSPEPHWRSQAQLHSAYNPSPATATSSSRPMRAMPPYPLGTKDFSHPLQVSVEHSHSQGMFSATSSASTGVLDPTRVKGHSGFTLYTPPQSLTAHRYRGETEFPPASSPMSLVSAHSKDDRPTKYRQFSGGSSGPPSSIYERDRHPDYPSRPHLSLLSTHAWSFHEAHRQRPPPHEESRDLAEGRYRSESIERGLSGSRELYSHASQLRLSSIGAKPHSFPSATDLSVPSSQQFALGFIPQLRSPSMSVGGSTSATRPKTKAIRSSQVPQSSRYTAAEVDQMVDAVANIPGNIVPCTLCQKYVKRERLRAHIHECHLLTGEKIICPHCGIALKSKGSFRVHIWRHKRGALPTRGTMTDFGRDPSGPPSPTAGPASH